MILRVLLLTPVVGTYGFATAAEYDSHPPIRPLAEVSQRAKAEGPAKFVDAARGDDEAVIRKILGENMLRVFEQVIV